MKLVMLNGPCGVGKSTAAIELQKELPLSLLIDIDSLRRTIGGYKDLREESLRAAYADTVALAGAHLSEGYSVIVEKIVFNNDTFLETLRACASKHGAEFHEILLTADKETVISRTEERGFKAGGSLTPQKVIEFWEAGQEFAARRSDLVIINTTNVAPEKVWQQIKEIIL